MSPMRARVGALRLSSLVLVATSVSVAVAAEGTPPTCPYLSSTEARTILGGEVAVEVADFDSALDGASSCRFSRAGESSRSSQLVIAEVAAASVLGDPFATLRSLELTAFPVDRAPWSILVAASALEGLDQWYAGLALVPGVVLLWADEDGFQSAIALDLPGTSAEAQRSTLSRVLDRVVGQLTGSGS